MERFVLPKQRTLLSGSTVASVVARCDENNLRRVVAGTVGQGVLGARPAPNFAPAAAVQPLGATRLFTLLPTWRAFRRGDTVQTVIGLNGTGTLTVLLRLKQSGEDLGSAQIDVPTAGWSMYAAQVTLGRRVDFAHDGDIEVRLTWTGSGNWAGAVVHRVSNAFESAFLSVPGGLLFRVNDGSGVTPAYRPFAASGVWGLVTPFATGQMCFWAEIVTSDSVYRAVVQGLDESTSTGTELSSYGVVQWGPEFPSGDIVQIAVVKA